MTGALRVAPLDGSNAEAWCALFERASVACYCRWWHFAGTKSDWLLRSATDPGANRDDAERAIACASPEASGLVAMRRELAVGWIKVAPRTSLAKLTALGPYRPLKLTEPDGAWSIGCLLVDPSERRHGVARALVAAAVDFAREHGAPYLEAYPRHRPESQHGRLHDEEVWMGPEAIYADLGFSRVQDERATEQYPLYRAQLEAVTAP